MRANVPFFFQSQDHVEYLRVVAIFLLARFTHFNCIGIFYDCCYSKSLQTVGRHRPPSILLITSIFFSNVRDLRGLFATFSLAVALPLLRLDMVPLLFFDVNTSLRKGH
jgi:hypothetical protein